MQPPLLVLDLDETLLHSTTEATTRFTFSDGAHHTLLRPHLATFLEQLDPWWHFSVFTAAGSIYAQSVINGIRRHAFPRLELLFVFDRTRCTPRRNPSTGETTWLKDLKKVKRRGFPLERVLALDDTPEAFARHRGNHLHAPRWTGDPNDTFLLDVIPQLRSLAVEPNIRTALKQKRKDNFDER